MSLSTTQRDATKALSLSGWLKYSDLYSVIKEGRT